MFKSILIICTGNICRSPIGERLLRQRLSGITVESAGTYGLEGLPADDGALEVASAHGLSLEGHVARKVSRGMVNRYDLILAMTPKHIGQITMIAPEVRGKTLLYGEWLGQQEVPDPFRQSPQVYEYVYNLLGQASLEWVKKLRK